METRIEHLSPKNPDELNRFVQLERQLLHDKPYYVSDIDVDVAFRLSGASAFFHDALITLYICQTNGQPVGRCAAMVLPGGKTIVLPAAARLVLWQTRAPP